MYICVYKYIYIYVCVFVCEYVVFKWEIVKKGILALLTSMMSLYEGAKTRVRVDSEL